MQDPSVANSRYFHQEVGQVGALAARHGKWC